MLPSKKSNDIVLYIVYNLWKFVNCCSKIIICWHLQIHSCIKSSTRAAERGRQRGKFVLGPHFLEALQKFCWEVKHNNYYTVKGYTCTCPHLSTCPQASGFLLDFNPFPPRLSKTTWPPLLFYCCILCQLILLVKGELLGGKGLRTVIVYSKLMNVNCTCYCTNDYIYIYFCY